MASYSRRNAGADVGYRHPVVPSGRHAGNCGARCARSRRAGLRIARLAGAFLGALVAAVVSLPGETDAQVYAINAGDIIAANYRAAGSTVVRVNPQTGAIRRVGLFNFPTDVTISADGYLYVSELGGLIKRVNLTNGVETVVNPSTTLSQIWGVALGPDGHLFVTTSVGDRIVKVNPATGAESLLAQGGQMSGLRGIDFLDANHAVVACYANNRVVSVSLLDQSQTTLAQGGNGIDLPWGISVFNGNIYVGAHDSRLLFRVTGSTVTNILPAIAPKLGGGPYGIGTDLDGNIVIGVSGGLVGPYAIERRDPLGNPLPGFSGYYIGEITGVEVSRISVPAANQFNTPPQLPPIGEISADEDVAMSLMADGTDSDWPLQELTYHLEGDVPAGADLSVGGVFVWKPGEAQGPSTNLFTVVVTDDGIPSLSATQTFTIVVNEVNSPPVVTPVGNRVAVVDSLLSFKINAADADLPAQALTFSLEPGAPLGATITPAGDFTWTPGASPGTGDYLIGVTVTDDAAPPLSDTHYFTVAVREVNVPPEFGTIPNQVANEGTLLTVQLAATDANVPAQNLAFDFAAGAPSGATLSAGGLFAWSPGEVQGPGSFLVSVRVSDDGLPPLSATNTFTVMVNEVNRPPVVAPIASQVADAGGVLTFTATASDPDAPVQQLTFGLGAGAPPGATITSTGNFTWALDAAEPAGTHVITVVATDNGNPPLSGSQTVTVDVRGGFSLNVGDIIVADFGGNAVVKIDGITGSPQSLGAFQSPTDVALGTNGILYVTEQGGGIQRLDLRSGQVSLVNSNSFLYDLRSIAIGATGELYVSTGWDDGIVRVNPLTAVETQVTQGGLISGPFGVAMLDSNHLIVSSHYLDRVVAVALTNNTQYLLAEGNGISQPWGVAVSDGVILVASSGAQVVQTLTGGTVTELLTLAASPAGIGVAANGSLWITANGAGPEIANFSPTGSPLTNHQAGLTGFSMGVEVVTSALNQPPVAGPDTVERDPAGGVKVSVAALLSNDADPDGDPISFMGASAASANGGTVVSNGGWLFYTPAAGFTNMDTFTYTISDGVSGPVTGTVNVNVRVDNGPSPNLAISHLDNGSYVIRGDGIPDRTYWIEFAEDPQQSNWLPLGTATADPFGIFLFGDTNGTPQRFYRSVYPQP